MVYTINGLFESTTMGLKKLADDKCYDVTGYILPC